MKKETVSMMKKKGAKDSIPTGILFLDIIRELEHIGDFLKNIMFVSSDLKFDLPIHEKKSVN